MSATEYPPVPGLLKTPSYSHVAVASGARTICLAGQVPADAEGKLVGGTDLAAQATQVMENIRTALAAAGASMADVVKITTYVVDYRPEHRAIISEVRARFFAGRAAPPASTLVGVAALASPDWLIEIEAVAVVG